MPLFLLLTTHCQGFRACASDHRSCHTYKTPPKGSQMTTHPGAGTDGPSPILAGMINYTICCDILL
eukprot:1151057-Pelagomonas_calceolata.AAC.2